jgi:hypothetical protein
MFMRFIFCFFLISSLFAAPSQYPVRRAQHPITIDGNLQDWSEGYFLDTIRSYDNQYYGDVWRPDDFNGRLYMAWDDARVYFAVIVTQDDHYCPSSGSPALSDNIKVSPGGLGGYFYLLSNGALYFSTLSTFQGSVIAAVNSEVEPLGRPVYEWYIDINKLASKGQDTFRLFVGVLDHDDCVYAGASVLGWGVEYLGDKGMPRSQDTTIASYPFFILDDSVPVVGADTLAPEISDVRAEALPFNAYISWTTNELATSSILYGISGQAAAVKNGKTFSTFHRVYLYGLLENTKYDYRVISKDLFGNTDTSTQFSFTTPALVRTSQHIFWYNARTRAYPLTDCLDSARGPCLDSGAVVHEGMFMSAGVAQHSGATHAGFVIGSGLDDAQGRCAVIWSRDLNDLAGSVAYAALRGEYNDGHDDLNRSGLIKIRCGVADFQPNIDIWGGMDLVPATAIWQDFLNPLSSEMGFDSAHSELMAEDSIYYTAVEGLALDGNPTVLDSQFFEINITNQVNWILTHEGQFAIVLLNTPGTGSYGKVNCYALEDGPGLSAYGYNSDHPWTQDGNTMHIVAYGDIGPVASEKKPPVAVLADKLVVCAAPNPFQSTVTIRYAGKRENGTLRIFTPDGRVVASFSPVNGMPVVWNARGLPNSVYIIEFSIAGKKYLSRTFLIR